MELARRKFYGDKSNSRYNKKNIQQSKVILGLISAWPVSQNIFAPWRHRIQFYQRKILYTFYGTRLFWKNKFGRLRLANILERKIFYSTVYFQYFLFYFVKEPIY